MNPASKIGRVFQWMKFHYFTLFLCFFSPCVYATQYTYHPAIQDLQLGEGFDPLNPKHRGFEPTPIWWTREYMIKGVNKG